MSRMTPPSVANRPPQLPPHPVKQAAPQVKAQASARVELAPAPDLDAPGAPYLTNHVEVGCMTAQQRVGLRRLVDALDLQQARLASGQRVIEGPAALRWILERLGSPSASVLSVDSVG